MTNQPTETEIVDAELTEGPFSDSPPANGAERTISRDVAVRPVWRPAPSVPDIVDGWVAHANKIWTLAEQIQDTDFVPGKILPDGTKTGLRGNPAAIAACILTGRELAIGPMMSLRYVQIVRGTPTLAAEYKRARVLAAGHGFRIIERTTSRCKLAGRRRGTAEWTEFVFTLDDARKANLLKADSAWLSRPRRMLFARATSEMCDAIFADVTLGLPTTELVEAGSDVDPFAAYAEPPAEGGPQATARRKTPASGGPAAAKPGPAPETSAPARDAAELEPEAGPAEDPDALITPEHRLHKRLFAQFRDIGLDGDQHRDARLRAAGAIAERALNSLDDLTVAEAEQVVTALDGAIAFGKTQSDKPAEQRQASFRTLGEVVREQEASRAKAEHVEPNEPKAGKRESRERRQRRQRNDPGKMSADGDPAGYGDPAPYDRDDPGPDEPSPE